MVRTQRLNNRIRTYRRKRRLSQEQLAKKVGVSTNTIGSIERGVFAPSAYLAAVLCQFFGCQFSDLFSLVQNDAA